MSLGIIGLLAVLMLFGALLVAVVVLINSRKDDS